MNELVGTASQYVCVTRPRRFGKTLNAMVLDVLITQANSYGNTFPAVPLSFKILKIPTSSDFDCILPASLEYDGTEKQVIIRPKDGIIGMGEITLIIYVDSNGNESTTAPTNYGIYWVKFNVARGTDYIGVMGLRAQFYPSN